MTIWTFARMILQTSSSVIDYKISEPIQDKLAESFNAGLCLTTDRTMLSEIVLKLKRPANIPDLRQPKLNQEIKRAGVK